MIPAGVRGLLLTVVLGGWPAALAAQLHGPIPSMRLSAGTLSFDGHATPGDFTGSTSAVTGEMTGGESLAAVRGWVEAEVKTLNTGNGRRDKDLNKSMETDQHPTMRFDLTGVAVEGVPADSAAVRLGEAHAARRDPGGRGSGPPVEGRRIVSAAERFSRGPGRLRDRRADEDARHAADAGGHRGARGSDFRAVSARPETCLGRTIMAGA